MCSLLSCDWPGGVPHRDHGWYWQPFPWEYVGLLGGSLLVDLMNWVEDDNEEDRTVTVSLPESDEAAVTGVSANGAGRTTVV